MNPSPWQTNESMLPKRAHPGERILLLPMLFCFLIGFCTSILYSTMVAQDSISLGALAGLFIFPPVLGYHTFATPTDSSLAKHIAFFTIVFAELACCASLYFHWKSIPIPKFSTSNFLYWPFVRTHNDGYVGDAVWIANQCFLAGIIASLLAIYVYTRIHQLFRFFARNH
jgi:hypothetical protein